MTAADIPDSSPERIAGTRRRLELHDGRDLPATTSTAPCPATAAAPAAVLATQPACPATQPTYSMAQTPPRKRARTRETCPGK
eukprot:gene3497-2745_t